jgi:hypothetical protein
VDTASDIVSWFTTKIDTLFGVGVSAYGDTRPYWKWIILCLVFIAFSKIRNPKINVGGGKR